MKNIYLVALSLLISVSISFGQSRVYAPELQYPENGAVDQMPEVVLNWHAVTGIGMDIQYEVQLSVDTDFITPVVFPFSKVTALNAYGLMFGDTYYWHVRAHDGDDISDWSETWSFEVVKTVNITAPNDGVTVNPQVTIEWDAVNGVDFYQILVDTLYSWKKENIGSSSTVNATFVIDSNNYGGVGDDGLVFYYDGTWNIGESGTTKDLLGVYFVAADNGWAVGKSGTITHYDGNIWDTVDIGATKELRAVYFADANNGWVVGKSGVIYYYNGTDWTLQDSVGSTKDFNAVWALSSTDVWVAGKSGIMVHSDGTDWSVDTIGTKDFMGLWFNTANDGWAVGKSGRVAHYDGTAWTEVSTGVSKVFYSVAFNGNQGYIVGQTGTLMEYNGSTWVKVTSGTNKDLKGIWFADGAGLFGGNDGAAYTFTGGGFNSPYATTYNVSGDDNSSDLHNLFFGSTYYYKMRMGHSNDTSDWSAPKSFQIQRSPELSSPEDGTSDIALRVVLDWKDYEGIQKYNIQISDNPDFLNTLTYGSDSSSYSINGMDFGKEYYWRVNAEHALASSPWSEVWSFITTNSVVLSSPENNSINVNACPLLEWEAIPGVASYEVWIDVDENFSNPMSKVETIPSSQCQSQLQKKTDYFWKVRAIVALDTSDWSPTWKFTTAGPDAINEIVDISSVTIFPNPTAGAFTVKVNSLVDKDVTVNVTDVSGKVVFSNKTNCTIGENRLTVDIKDLPTGIYQVSIVSGNSLISQQLMVK